MRIKINDKDIMEDVNSIQIVCGANTLYINVDYNGKFESFGVQTLPVQCEDCEAFYDDECKCKES